MNAISGLRLNSPLLIPIYFLVVLRIGFFVGTMVWPIPNEMSRPTSPLHQSGTDLHYYMSAAAKMAEFGPLGILHAYVDFYSRLELPEMKEMFNRHTLLEIREQADDYIEYLNVGPLFPFLLNITKYNIDNTIPLSVVFLIMGLFSSVLWIIWLDKFGVPFIWIFVFIFLPAPQYYSISIGTDLPFMFFMTLFILFYFRKEYRESHFVILSVSLLGLALLRPVALSILAFVIMDLIFFQSRNIEIRTKVTLLGITVFLLFMSMSYYLPHGAHTIGSSSSLSFFNVRSLDYYQGLFPTLPSIVDKTVSVLLLFAAKVFYFVGLRPSFGGSDIAVVLVRAAPGIILIAGLIWGLFCAGWRMRIFLVLMLIPVIAGPAQDRYNLPIQPLLFYFGGCFFTWCVQKALGRWRTCENDGAAGKLALRCAEPFLFKMNRQLKI